MLVKRLIAQIAPVVREIAKHSQSSDELVVKRVLADNRREETFVAKAELLRKFASLSPGRRACFEPLGLGSAAPEEARGRKESPATSQAAPTAPPPESSKAD